MMIRFRRAPFTDKPEKGPCSKELIDTSSEFQIKTVIDYLGNIFGLPRNVLTFCSKIVKNLRIYAPYVGLTKIPEIFESPFKRFKIGYQR